MSAADKVSGMYTFHGAHVMTSTPTRALLIINGSKVVFNLNCSLGTGFLTFAAGYTAVLANLTHLCALVMTATFNYNF